MVTLVITFYFSYCFSCMSLCHGKSIIKKKKDVIFFLRKSVLSYSVSCSSAVVTLLYRILCQCGLDVSAMDFDGWTPLHAAAHWGQGEACRILAEQLCNMEARSNAVGTKNSKNLFLLHCPACSSIYRRNICHDF